MRKTVLIVLALLLAVVVVSAQWEAKSGGGRFFISRTGDIIIKARSDKSIALQSNTAVTGTFSASGAVTASSTLGVTGAATLSGKLNSCEDAGANDTYACSLSPALAAYATGQVFWFKANTANTGAATLNLNALGAKTIKKNKDADLADNDIKAGQWVSVQYDGTNMQLLSPVSNAGGGGLSGLTTGQYLVATGATTASTDGVKRYVAILAQSGTDAPVATVLENTLGGSVVWTREDAGDYTATLAGAFPSGKTAVLMTGYNTLATAARATSNTVTVRTIDPSLPGADDNKMGGATIMILVYP